jgi:hypothetical protein
MDRYFERLWELAPHVPEKDREWYEKEYINASYQEIIFLNEFTLPFYPYYKTNHLAKDWNNFVYDRKTGCVLVQFDLGHHEPFMGSMRSFYKTVVDEGKTIDDMKIGDWRDQAEDFIIDGIGFFMSSASRFINVSSKVKMTMREQVFFEGFKFRAIDD